MWQEIGLKASSVYTKKLSLWKWSISTKVETMVAIVEAAVELLSAFLSDLFPESTPSPMQPTPDSTTDETKLISEADKTLREIQNEYPQSLRVDIHMRVLRNSQGKIHTIEYYSDNPIVGYHEYGTGIYGPYKVKITPTFAKVLHFKDRELAMKLATPLQRATGDVGDDVFLASVKGIKPKFAITKALKRLMIRLPGWSTYSDRMEAGY